MGSENHRFVGVDGNVINEARITDGNIFVRPSGEELGLNIIGLGLRSNLGHCGDNNLIILEIIIISFILKIYPSTLNKVAILNLTMNLYPSFRFVI